MQTDLQRKIDRLKTTALMKAREQMGPVEVAKWWTTFLKNTRGIKTFDELDENVQAQPWVGSHTLTRLSAHELKEVRWNQSS